MFTWRRAAIALGILFAWTSRHSNNPDGISYLDVADAFRAGQWKSAISSAWSPLYPVLLSVASSLLKPSPYWEFPVVHLVNFGVYLCALMGFEFLLRELFARRRQQTAQRAREGVVALPESAWLALSYMAFLYGTLCLIQVATVTPDLCVAGVVFLSTGLLVRIQNGDIRLRTFALLGLVLGLGYFAKTFMGILGFVFLAMAMVAAHPRKQALPGVLVGLLMFLLTMSLFIVPLSRIKHRVTFGDVGKLSYAWQVLNLWDFPLNPAGTPGHGIPTHPCKILVNEPRIYAFGGSVGGTYPLAFDPPYWFEGITFHLEPWKHVPIVLKSITCYIDIFQVEFSLILGLIVLYGMRGRRSGWLKSILSQYSLFIPSLVALAIFGLINAEGRYVGPFVTLLLVGIITGVRLPLAYGRDRWVQGLVLVMLMGPVVNLLHAAGSAVQVERRAWKGLETPLGRMQWQVADALHRAGIQEGDPVVSLGTSYGAYWARLSRTRIVAEAPDPEQFWNAPPSVQSRALGALKKIGARAVVGQRKAPWRPLIGWRQVAHTDYFFHRFEADKD